MMSIFSAGQESTRARPQQADSTPTSKQPATFTVEEVATFQRWLEEGYDLPDPRYMQWLASVGASCRPKHLNHKAQEEAANSYARMGHVGIQGPDSGLAVASVRCGTIVSV